MKQKVAFGIIGILLIVFGMAPARIAHAATKVVIVPTQAASDDPHLNSNPSSPTLGTMGVELQSPLNDTTTQISDASLMDNSPHAYTWRLDIPELCSGAELLSLRITTQTVAEDEEPTTGVFLNPYRVNNLTMFDGSTINGGNGEDANTWVPALFATDSPAIDRGTSGSFGPYTTFPADLGMNGTLDGTWDISGYPADQGLGVYVQHWLAGDTATAQTTIQSATLTYDDSGCSLTNSGGADSNSDSEKAELASTGENTSVIAALSLLLVISGLSVVTYNCRRQLNNR